jgi:hypothetical protein
MGEVGEEGGDSADVNEGVLGGMGAGLGVGVIGIALVGEVVGSTTGEKAVRDGVIDAAGEVVGTTTEAGGARRESCGATGSGNVTNSSGPDGSTLGRSRPSMRERIS